MTSVFLLGPVIVLANEGLTYALDHWACLMGTQAALHLADAICLAFALSVTVVAARAWGRLARALDSKGFLAVGGIALGSISALLILAQWAAIFVFQSCSRAS